MKKLGAILLVVGILLGAATYSYYSKTYKKETAYAIVSTEIPNKEQTKDINGDEIHNYSSYNYNLTFVKNDGKKEVKEYEISGINPEPLEPGAYVTAEISKKRIIAGPHVIGKSKIPKNVLNVLDKIGLGNTSKN